MVTPSRLAALVALFTVALAAAPQSVSAQAMGTAFSGPTTADAASAWVNPAAMAAGDDTHLELVGGVTAIDLTYAPASGAAASESHPLTPILTAGGYTAAIHPDWRVGLTFGVPGTQGGKWARDGGAAGITRYFMVDGAIFQLSLTPAVSWSPAPWISVGAGAELVYGSLEMEFDKDLGTALNQTLGSTAIDSPFPYADPSLAAPVTASADGVGIGAIGGIYLRPLEELSLGVSIHSPVSIDAAGSLSVDYPETVRQFVHDTLPSAELPDLDGRFHVGLDRPMVIVAGLSARPVPQLELGLQYQFDQNSTLPNLNVTITEASSSVIENTVKPQAYTDRHRVSARVAYAPTPSLLLAVVGAIQTNAIPDLTMAPNNLDFQRFDLGFAVRWQLAEHFSVLVQYCHTFLGERDIDESLHRPVAEHSLAAFNHPSPLGTYTGDANAVRLGLTLTL